MALVGTAHAEKQHERAVDRVALAQRGAAAGGDRRRADPARVRALGGDAERGEHLALEVEQSDHPVGAAQQPAGGEVVAPLAGMDERRHHRGAAGGAGGMDRGRARETRSSTRAPRRRRARGGAAAIPRPRRRAPSSGCAAVRRRSGRGRARPGRPAARARSDGARAGRPARRGPRRHGRARTRAGGAGCRTGDRRAAPRCESATTVTS